MSESQSSLSQRETFTPKWHDRFLWWLSTAEKELLINCLVDRNRYKIIGMTVLATWCFATLAWVYFWSTVSTNWVVAVLLGVFMGFVILTIDRALIKGIHKANKNRLLPLLLRSLLAVTLGTFMAQPAVLYMFNSEIKLQASLDNEKRKRAKQRELDSFYATPKIDLNARKILLHQQLLNKYREVNDARAAYVQEMDGTGGSGKIGIHNIAIAKKEEYEKLSSEYRQLTSMLNPQISDVDSSLKAISVFVANENIAFAGLLNNGFLTRIEALANLIKNNNALQLRYYLIIAILMLIELMPMLAKTLIPSGTYDDKVQLQEEMEKAIARSNQLNEKYLKELYNQLAKENDEAFLKDFFEQSKEQRGAKMKERFKKWTEGSADTFDGFWEDIKKDILTKQEN